MPTENTTESCFCQQLKVRGAINKLQPMVVDKDREEKLLFAARLNEMLDEAGVEPIGKGRQKILHKEFGVSEEAARKWLAGESMPHTKRIPMIAKRFNRLGEWLLTGIGEKRSMPAVGSGSDLVREAPPPAIESNVVPIGEFERDTPLISWAQAGDWIEHYQSFNADDAEDWLACPVAHSKRTFALWVQGISMEPDYREGEVIFVDPDVIPESRNGVIARMNGNKFTFKQIIMDEFGNAHLRARNPQWNAPIVEVNDEVEIVGTVIFAGRFTTKRLHPRGESQ